MRTPFALPLVLALACGAATVSPDEATVEQHRREAARERLVAQQEVELGRVAAERQSQAPIVPDKGAFSPTGRWLYPSQVYNPHGYSLDSAAAHSAHARAHEEAADALERFEAAECSELPPETRASCPILGPAVGWRELDRGVEVSSQEGIPVAAVVAHMRCHQAFARAHGYLGDCPLYMKGLEIRASEDGRGVLLTTDKPADVTPLRQRARQQIVVGKPARVL